MHCGPVLGQIKKLKGEYRKIIDKLGKTREGRKSGIFFEALHRILAHRPTMCPSHVIDFAIYQA